MAFGEVLLLLLLQRSVGSGGAGSGPPGGRGRRRGALRCPRQGSIPPAACPLCPGDERREGEGAGEGGQRPGSTPRSRLGRAGAAGTPPPPPSPPRLPARREPPRQGAAGPLPGGAGEPATGIGRERAKVDRIHFSFAGRKHPGTVGQ